MSINQARTALLMMKGAISEMPKEDRDEMDRLIGQLREFQLKNGDKGNMAVLMIACEIGLEPT